MKCRCRHSMASIRACARGAVVIVVCLLLHLRPSGGVAQELMQDAASPSEDSASVEEPPVPQVPRQQVDVEPVSQDEDIQGRLQSILEATGWFEDVDVRVDEGVAFLSGRAAKPEYKDWAGNLAASTQDVVAVVNRVRLIEGPWWDLTPAWTEIRSMV